MAGNRHDFTVVQAKLAGKTEDLFGFARDGEHNCQRIFGHIIGDRKIRVIDMVTELSYIRKEPRTIFR